MSAKKYKRGESISGTSTTYKITRKYAGRGRRVSHKTEIAFFSITPPIIIDLSVVTSNATVMITIVSEEIPYKDRGYDTAICLS